VEREMNPAELFKFYKNILEILFPKDWFIKASETHEAFQQYKICNKVIAQKGIIKYPEQASELPAIGKIFLNSFVLSKITNSDMSRLIIGSLKYGNKKVKGKIKQKFPDLQHFQDIMVELYMGAWHITKGNIVTPLEKEGLPDLMVNFPNVSETLYIECKNLHTKDKRRIADVICKANNQLENTKKHCYDCLAIDATIPISAGYVQDDSLPSVASEIIEEIQSLLSGNEYRAIGSAVLIWDDFMILGTPPQKVAIAYRRRCHRIDHKNPKKAILKSISLFEGFTTYYSLRWIV